LASAKKGEARDRVGAARSSAARLKSLKVAGADVGPLPPPRIKDLVRLAEKVLRAELPKTTGAVNLVFCENAYVRELNRRFRKLDKVTDVLSFIYEEDDVFGEIYIATLKAQKQAPRWKNTFYDELRRLVVHGALHLAGFDHMNAKDRKAMRTREDFYLAP
jgi:probable rRNA maturation factor